MTMAHSVEDIVLTEIDLLEIDQSSFTDVESSPETVRFSIILTSAPSPGWVTVFHTLYDKARLIIRPPVEVIEDRLWIDFLPRYEKDLQAYINQLRGVAKLTNDDMKHSSEISAGIHADANKQEFRQRLLSLKI
jgi:hypothetical protein